MVANRSSDDPKWVQCKAIVDKRDKRACQFDRCLSAKEFYQFIDGNPKIKDRAHVFAVSAHPELLYQPKNVVTLRRFIHQRMDNYLSPLNGKPISIEEHYYWWYRIVTHQVLCFDETIDYEALLQSTVR